MLWVEVGWARHSVTHLGPPAALWSKACAETRGGMVLGQEVGSGQARGWTGSIWSLACGV